MIRVCIVDDHAGVRAGLERLLDALEDVLVVGAVADARDAVDIVADRRPDVVLMDLSMPIVDGVAATRAITAAVPGTRVLVLTAWGGSVEVRDALKAGAVGYVLKDAEVTELDHGIRAAAGSERVGWSP